jgi:UDP-N-acetylmuramate--alanine ligase
LPGPLAGRRIWFVGIGGAGLSGYAVLTKSWGAEVGGWDRVETPYLQYVRAAGIEPKVEREPVQPPAGYEVVVSSAFAGQIAGRSRAELLAELVALQPSIVVSGAHGKTTTAAMIAFVLDRLGAEPAFLIGGEVPQLGGNARAGSGRLVVEGDESDRTIAALRPEIAVVTNVDLDHHSTFASRAEVEALFEEWLARVPKVVRGDALQPADLQLAVPGEHNRRNAAAALDALELTGVARSDAERELTGFTGVRRRMQLVGETSGVRIVDDYAHNPAKLEAAIAAAREGGAGRVLVLFQPHLFSRTRYLAFELARALAAADVVAVTEIYPAREQPLGGVTGKLVVDALTEIRPGLNPGWLPVIEDGVRFLARRVRPGDTVLVAGAGDVDRAVPLLLEQIA